MRMDTKEKKRELRKVAEAMFPEPIIIIGYIEHYIDLMGKVIEDLSSVVDTSQLSPEQQERLNKLKEFLQYSSVDFNNISDPLESYKLPSALQLKADTRNIQRRYLEAQLREGIFD
jgi:hypothetical protein